MDEAANILNEDATLDGDVALLTAAVFPTELSPEERVAVVKEWSVVHGKASQVLDYVSDWSTKMSGRSRHQYHQMCLDWFLQQSELARNDVELVRTIMGAVHLDLDEFLQYAGEAPRRDAVVMSAVNRRPGLLRYASAALRDDVHIVRMAMQRDDGNDFQFASPRLRSNEALLRSMLRSSDCVKYACEECKESIFAEATRLRRNASWLYHASDDLLEPLIDLALSTRIPHSCKRLSSKLRYHLRAGSIHPLSVRGRGHALRRL